MNIIADTHTHTTASTHAYSTLEEMVRAAARRSLYALAVTDHGTSMPGSPGKWYFKNMQVLPRELEGVLLLRGQETNVIDYEGNVDLNPNDEPSMDWIVASIHSICMPKIKPTEELVTNLWTHIAHDPRVNVIGHSGHADYPYDYETLIPEFGRNGKLVELNEGTFFVREKSIPNCKKIMELCKKHGVPIVINSDSHFSSRVGCFQNSLALLREIDFPEELVVNSSITRFQQYLKQYTRVFENQDPEAV